MRDNPIHTFLQFMAGQIPDQLALHDLRWFAVGLYWLLFVAGLAIAIANWIADPRQRTGQHVAVFLMRFTIAGMWYLGTLWKLPLPVSEGFKFWLGETVKYSSLQAHSDIMQFMLDHIAVAQPLVYLTEVFLTASLMLGFLVGLSGTVGVLFTLNLMVGLYNNPSEWPWTYVGIICAHGMFAVTGAGRSLGLDNMIRVRPLAAFAGDRLLTRVYPAMT